MRRRGRCLAVPLALAVFLLACSTVVVHGVETTVGGCGIERANNARPLAPVELGPLTGLFFGLTIPLALRTGGGWMFPGVFALGSSLPLLVVAGVIAAGLGTIDHVTGGMKRVERALRVVAGVVLILAGLHDTIVYWMI